MTLKYARTDPSTSLVIYNLLLPLYFIQYVWIKVASLNKTETHPYYRKEQSVMGAVRSTWILPQCIRSIVRGSAQVNMSRRANVSEAKCDLGSTVSR